MGQSKMGLQRTCQSDTPGCGYASDCFGLHFSDSLYGSVQCMYDNLYVYACRSAHVQVFMFMHVCMCALMCVYMHMCMHVHVCVRTCVCMHMYICMNVYLHVRTSAYVYVCV